MSTEKYLQIANENNALRAEISELKRLLAVEQTINAFHQQRLEIKEQVRELEKRWAAKEGAAV